MKKKNYIILLLLILSIGLFSFVTFYYIPTKTAKESKKEEAMLSYKTHDFSKITNYDSKYMGDASNLSGLLSNLPLSNVSRSLALDSNARKLTINYQTTYTDLTRTEQRGNLIYTGVASFVLIDNLKEIAFKFQDVTLTITREGVEDHYKNLSKLKTPSTWKTKVQDPLKQKSTMTKLFKQLFTAE